MSFFDRNVKYFDQLWKLNTVRDVLKGSRTQCGTHLKPLTLLDTLERIKSNSTYVHGYEIHRDHVSLNPKLRQNHVSWLKCLFEGRK